MQQPLFKSLLKGKRLAVFLLAGCLALGAAAQVWAVPTDAAPDIDAQFAQVRTRMDAVRDGMNANPSDEDMAHWRAEMLQTQTKVDALDAVLEPKLADITARLQQLGAPPEGVKESPDVAQLRAQLQQASTTVGAQIKLAKLLSVETAQLADQISNTRRAYFQAQLGERGGTFFSNRFRAELARELPGDMRRFGGLGSELLDGARQTPMLAWLAIVVGLLVLVAAHYVLRTLLLHLSSIHVPSGRLRRSVHAAARALLAAAVPGLMAALIYQGLTWSGTLSDGTKDLLGGLAGIVCLAGYVNGMGVALMAPRRASWRLLPLPDTVAMGLRRLPDLLAVLLVFVWLSQRLPTVLDLSPIITVCMVGLTTFVQGVALAWGLIRAERLLRSAAAQEKGSEKTERAPRPYWVAALFVLTWLALAIGIVCVSIGYAALGTFIITKILWALIVALSAYLLMLLINDFCMTLLAGEKLEHPTPQSRLRRQMAVLLSGAGRLVVLLIAVVLVFNSFSDGLGDILHSLNSLRNGVQLGAVNLKPGSVLQAVLVLVLGLACVRIVKIWLRDSYLPATTMDAGMRVSTSTLFGYASMAAVVALALSALGFGLERVAWIASALSVGIGFGLQAVVQNFVSGLILLAERPVKVGDWVSLGSVEGDIQRINVRATEILLSDKSTVIVPNSEFITKTLRNVTHARSMGRVQFTLPMPQDAEAEKVREVIRASFAAQPEILAAPAADIYLEGVTADGRLMYNAIAYVESPRAAYGVRSRVLYDMSARMASAGLSLSSSSTVLLRHLDNPSLKREDDQS